MLTRKNVEVDEASFGTVESDPIGIAGTHSFVDVVQGTLSDPGIMTTEDEEWNVVHPVEGGGGILIVAGEEEEQLREPSEDDGLVLSMPSFENLPSLNGSLEGIVEHPREVETAGVQSAAEMQSSSIEEQSQTEPVAVSWRRLMLLLAVAIVILPTVTTVYLLRERKQVLMSRNDLERELEKLRETAEKTRMELEEKTKERLSSEASCKDDQATLVDNCWVTAKANVKLGDCANAYKDSLKNHLWGNSTTSWHIHLEKDVAGESVKKFLSKVDYLGRSLWNVTTEEVKKSKTVNEVRLLNRTIAGALQKVRNQSSAALGAVDRLGLDTYWNLTFEVQRAKREIQQLKTQISELSKEMKASSILETVDRLGIALWNITATDVENGRKFVNVSAERSSFLHAMVRNTMDKIGSSLWNFTAAEIQWAKNLTKLQTAETQTKAVAQYFSFRDTMDKIGHSLWNLTSGEIQWARNMTNSHVDTSSFLDKVERVGQTFWYATTGVGMKVQNSTSRFFRASQAPCNATEIGRNCSRLTNRASSFWTKFSFKRPPPPTSFSSKEIVDDYDMFDAAYYGMYDALVAASALSMAMGESIIAATMEAAEVMDFNRSLSYMMEVTKYAVEEASLTRAIGV